MDSVPIQVSQKCYVHQRNLYKRVKPGFVKVKSGDNKQYTFEYY